MNATNTVKVGDVFLVRRHNAESYSTDNVSRVTAKGWVKLALNEKVGHFKLAYNGEYLTGDKSYDLVAVPATDEWKAKWDELLAREKAFREEKETARKEREAAATKRHDEEMAAVKEATGGNLLGLVRGTDRVGNDKLVWLALPVKPELAERKGTTEHVWVRLKETMEWDFAASRETGEEVKVKMIEAYHTYANGNGSSFPSCSGIRCKTEEEALWEVARSVYHSW